MIIVDRIIDGLAICEKDGTTISIPLSVIVGNVREGDVLCEIKSSAGYAIDTTETSNRRESISSRFERIKNRHRDCEKKGHV